PKVTVSYAKTSASPENPTHWRGDILQKLREEMGSHDRTLATANDDLEKILRCHGTARQDAERFW
ncbi:MAG: hypothetical protein ACLGIP_20305, partial [Alphaproteobacteria bacterium]